MIRRISKNNDYKDIITSYPVDVIDSIYKIEYYIGGHADESYSATFTKNVNVLVAIIPSSALKEMPNGMLYRKAYYKVSDSSYTDGYYDLEMVDNMEVWVGEEDVTPYLNGSSLEAYATKTWVNNKGYLTEDDLDDYAKQSDIPTVPTKVSELTNDSGFINSQSLDDCVKISKVMDGYNVILNDAGQLKAKRNFDTDSPNDDLNFASLGTVRNFYNKCVKTGDISTVAGVPTKLSQLTNDSGYATESWVEGKNYLTEHQSLADYALKSELPTVPSLEDYVTHDWLEEQDYASFDDIPSLDGYATESWVEGKNYLTEHQSLADYALKSELPTVPSLDGYATESWVEGKNYLTEHQSLADYALKSELPTVPSLDGYATESWVEGKNYLTEHQSLDDYLKISNIKGSYNVLVNGNGELKCKGGFTPDSTNDSLNFASLGTVRNFYNRCFLKKDSYKNFIHVSMDDTSDTIDYINDSSNASIYGNTLLAAMKYMHDNYGMVFSLYVFKNLSFDTSTTEGASKKQELFDAREWLKFGYHMIGTKSCDELTYTEAKTIYTTFVNSVIACCGSAESIDRIPRLDYFKSGKNGLMGFRDAPCGLIGTYSPDDNRTTGMYLPVSNTNWLAGIDGRNAAVATNWYPKDFLTDNELGIRLFRTDFRLDVISNTTGSWNAHDTATGEKSGNADNVYATLENWYKDGRHGDMFCPLAIFFHETEWTSGRITRTYFEKIATFANDYHLSFDFPQNRFIERPTHHDIFQTTAETAEVVEIAGVQCTIVDQLSDIPASAMIKGGLNGGTNPVSGTWWTGTLSSNKGKVISINYNNSPVTAYAIDLTGKSQIRFTDTSKAPAFACVILSDTSGNMATNADETKNKLYQVKYWWNTSTDGNIITLDGEGEKYLFPFLKNAVSPTSDFTTAQIQDYLNSVVIE